MSTITEWLQVHEHAKALAIVAASVLAAVVVELLRRRVAARLTERTATDLDDEVVERLRHPVAATVLLVGAHFSVATLYGASLALTVTDAGLVTVGVALWIAAALRVAAALAKRTKTDVDDEVVRLVRLPLAATVVLIGVRVIASTLELEEGARFVTNGVLVTLGVLLWARAAVRIGRTLLVAVSRAGRFKLVETRTMPLFDILVQTVVYLGGAYVVLLAWHVDVTAWLASAGIVGIAVGFAAKDTLANLFAGIFIIADAPYKVGDFIVLDSGERGRVTNIGIRSTRILTRDDIEVTIPNASLGNAKIVNETGGPHEKERIRLKVGVAYGSDVDKVRETLLAVALASELVSRDGELDPRVRFRAFGESSLDFELLAWIDEPVLRGRALDELHTAVYKRFAEEGIEIAFPQRDIWVRSLPATVAKPAD